MLLIGGYLMASGRARRYTAAFTTNHESNKVYQ
jgi:hypothetical protein